MRKELLRISHVDLERDGELLLDDLEFQMFAGEIVGLVARNRKGQKEMVDMICRNDPISLGSVWYDGNVVNSYAYSSGASNKVALIEQKSHLVQGLSVVDNLFILREGFCIAHALPEKGLIEPCLGLLYIEEGVDFGHEFFGPVHMLFYTCFRESSQWNLKILRTLISIAENSDLCGKISAKDGHGIYEIILEVLTDGLDGE